MPSFTVCRLLKVDIGIAQRPARDHVPAHPDGQDGTGRAELLVEHGFSHVLVQVSNIQGGHGVTGSAGVHFLFPRSCELAETNAFGGASA